MGELFVGIAPVSGLKRASNNPKTHPWISSEGRSDVRPAVSWIKYLRTADRAV